FADHQPRRRGRRKSVDVELAKRDADRRAPYRLVIAEIPESEDAAGGTRAVDDPRGDFAVVKIVRSLFGEPLQRGRQRFLHEQRFRINHKLDAALLLRASNIKLLVGVETNALLGQPDGRRDEILP